MSVVASRMPSKLILLTGEVEAPHLSKMLRKQSSSLIVEAVTNAPGLSAAAQGDLAGVRLVSFLSDVIVPAAILSALDGPAYNFHPGPPAYPGSFVAGFAVYDGATEFGVTLHEMAPSVDSGSIIDVWHFPIPEDAKFLDVERVSYATALQMFADYAPYLATDDTPLPHTDEHWSDRQCTRAEAERLKRIEADLSEEEIVRRYRAFG